MPSVTKADEDDMIDMQYTRSVLVFIRSEDKKLMVGGCYKWGASRTNIYIIQVDNKVLRIESEPLMMRCFYLKTFTFFQ